MINSLPASIFRACAKPDNIGHSK